MAQERSKSIVVTRLGTSADLHGFIALLEDAETWLSSKGIAQWAPGSNRAELAALSKMLSRGTLVLAYGEDALIGGCILTRTPTEAWPDRGASAAYLSKLVVARPYAGTGMSAKIIAACSEWARAQGLRSIRLDCWDGNDHLRALYRNLAFIEGAAVPEQGWLVRLFELPLGDVLPSRAPW